jgi:hypothetical protein
MIDFSTSSKPGRGEIERKLHIHASNRESVADCFAPHGYELTGGSRGPFVPGRYISGYRLYCSQFGLSTLNMVVFDKKAKS